MSFQAFLDDLAGFNFSHAGKRVADWFRAEAWPGLKKLVTKASGEEEKILEEVITQAVQEVLAGGLTTDAFVTAGKNALAALIAKNVTTFNMQYVMALVNAEVAPLAPPAVAVANNGG